MSNQENKNEFMKRKMWQLSEDLDEQSFLFYCCNEWNMGFLTFFL